MLQNIVRKHYIKALVIVIGCFAGSGNIVSRETILQCFYCST